MNISELINSTVPYILAPRLTISIWDTHAHRNCVYVSTTFEDCGCWASPGVPEQHEMNTTSTQMESETGSYIA